MLAAALAWHEAGCAVIPIRADGSKAPLVPWRAYQSLRPDRGKVEGWFPGNPPGIAVISGAASAGLEMLEPEGRAVAEGLGQALIDLLGVTGLASLWERVTAGGYWERTPSGGVHLLYRVEGDAVNRNLKLARRLATEEELFLDPADKIKTLAETRGEGGYTIVAPSHGTVHETLRPWVALSGSSPARIPSIISDERTARLDVIRALDAMPPAPATAPRGPGSSNDESLSPGDDYERRTDWTDILVPAGWTLVQAIGRTRYWRRPGKRFGVSATTGRADDRDRLFVFSSSTELETDTPLTKFHVLAVLQHAGDHGAAARALRQAGYGGTTPRREPSGAPRVESRFGVADARGGKGQRFYTGVALLIADPQTALPVGS